MNLIKSIESIVNSLESLQRRPMMTLSHTDSVNSLIMFLMGFHDACRTLGVFYSIEVEREILKENGWERRADGVWVQMQERGMDDESIVHTVIGLEIAKWKRLLNREMQSLNENPTSIS